MATNKNGKTKMEIVFRLAKQRMRLKFAAREKSAQPGNPTN